MMKEGAKFLRNTMMKEGARFLRNVGSYTSKTA
jgi:thermostable 8-oxoguanine DNA glycosylase